MLINDIVFKEKRSVNWNDVKNYLETYAGEFYEIADTEDIVYNWKRVTERIHWFAVYIFAERGKCEGITEGCIIKNVVVKKDNWWYLFMVVLPHMNHL